MDEATHAAMAADDPMHSLADLDATITVFADRFPEHALHAARKGLSRLAQQAGDRNAVIPGDQLLALHEPFKADVGKGWYDERSALKRLIDLPEVPADVLARIRRGERAHRARSYPVLEGRGQRRIAQGHRSAPPPPNSATPREIETKSDPAKTTITPRSLAFYDAVGRRLAGEGVSA
jgi:hypothetical protein